MSLGKSLKKFLLIFMLLLSPIFLTGKIAYADGRDDVDSITFIGENQTAVVSICSKANNVAGSKIIVYEGKDGMLSFSNSKYALLPIDVRRDFM